MPHIYKGFLVKQNFVEMPITRMTVNELKDYEAYLLTWTKNGVLATNLATVVEAIHRELDWRAQDSNFN
jgi:hypothetical protein